MEPSEFVNEYIAHRKKELVDEEYKTECMVGILHANLSVIFSTLGIYHPDALNTVLSRGNIGEFYRSLNTKVSI